MQHLHHQNNKEILHINHFRNSRYRVFYSAPYFTNNIVKEIEWHTNHVKSLRKLKKKPHLFHRQFTEGEITPQREAHFREHVIDSIPFHEKIIDEHMQRVKLLKELMTYYTYKKIVALVKKHGALPEYFVYDKEQKKMFFVTEHLDEKRQGWIEEIARKKLFEVVNIKN